MTPSQRLLFMDMLRSKNKLPYIFILLILITIALTMWTRNNYFAFLWGALLIVFFCYMVIQNIINRKTYCHKPFNSYYRAIKKGRRIFFEAIADDKRLNPLKSYAIIDENETTYTLQIDHYNWHTYTATFFKADVLEDPNLLPNIEEKMRNHPENFGL